MSEIKAYDFIIVGGGIAGISALEQIYQRLPQSTVLLLTASSFVKVATTRLKLTSRIEELDIQQKAAEEFHDKHSSLVVVIAKLESILSTMHCIIDSLGATYRYRNLCICTGSIPKLIEFKSPYVIGLRDTDSALQLKNRLSKSKRVCVIGNGGIATELIYELKSIDVVWVVRHNYVASTFVDAGAAQFLMDSVNLEKNTNKPAKSLRYTVSQTSSDNKTGVVGCALGPNWHNDIELTGAHAQKSFTVEYQSEVENISEKPPPGADVSDEWPIYVTLSNGKTIGCDFVVSATGVLPSVPHLQEGNSFELGEDGGILVNEYMQTSIPDIYAAGDVCTVNWDIPLHWFQMRLWTQARPMGGYAGQCMVSSFLNETPVQDFSFELFTHVTRFFGYRVVLLGLFNGQKLDGRYEALVRVTRGVEYIKLVVQDGRIHGAVLIGDTEMEETFENLILNQLDVSRFGEDILNPDIDIDDYFD